MQIVSVVRDFEIYNKLIKNNKFYSTNTNFIIFDNSKENITIPKRYNSFLESYDYSKEDWFVFCHEDWEAKEDLEQKLLNLNKDCLYGPIGMSFGKFYKKSVAYGIIIQSDKNGDSPVKYGRNIDDKNNLVGTFDCQCLIVHSSLIKKYHLRFDENLSWDLYVEDFCIAANEKHNICSKILLLKCQHYSHGAITKRFYDQLTYLRKKYRHSFKIYCTTVKGHAICNPLLLSLYNIPSFKRFFYQKKTTKSGKLLIKIFKIPVYRRKHVSTD